MFKWITIKDLLGSAGNSAYVAWMGGGREGGWIHMYAWLSSFAAL